MGRWVAMDPLVGSFAGVVPYGGGLVASLWTMTRGGVLIATGGRLAAFSASCGALAMTPHLLQVPQGLEVILPLSATLGVWSATLVGGLHLAHWIA